MIGELVREELAGLALAGGTPGPTRPYSIVSVQGSVTATPGAGNDLIAPLVLAWSDLTYALAASRRIVGWRVLVQGQINGDGIYNQDAGINASLGRMIGGALSLLVSSDTGALPGVDRPTGNGDWVLCPPVASDAPPATVNAVLQLGALTSALPCPSNGPGTVSVCLQLLLEAV